MSPSDHRTRAREALRGNWPAAVLISLVASLLGGISYTGPKLNINIDALLHPMDPRLAGLLGFTGTMVLGMGILGIVVSIVLGGAVHVGNCRYQLNLHDGTGARLNDLFCFMDHFGSALVMNLLRVLIVYVGMLLLVIPGIIAGIGLSMAGYILAEDPDCSATDALRRSWELMNGHKMDLFILQLSFLGWIILAGMTFGIGSLFLAPYRSAACCSFYRELVPAKTPQGNACQYR